MVLENVLWAVLFVAVICSLISFVLYGWDKRQAKVRGWRVPEKNFHTLSVLGGWPGALLGQQVFRHKTQKGSFRIKFWACVFVHVVLVGWLVYRWLSAVE